MPLGNSMTQRQKRNGTVAVGQDNYSDDDYEAEAEYNSAFRSTIFIKTIFNKKSIHSHEKDLGFYINLKCPSLCF